MHVSEHPLKQVVRDAQESRAEYLALAGPAESFSTGVGKVTLDDEGTAVVQRTQHVPGVLDQATSLQVSTNCVRVCARVKEAGPGAVATLQRVSEFVDRFAWRNV